MTAQTACLTYKDGDVVDYTPSSDVAAGAVILIGTVPMIATSAIPANKTGALACEGIFKVPKTSDTFSAGDAVYWDVDGTPVTGDALSGAADNSSATGNLMGLATEDAAAGDSYVKVLLTAAKRTTTIAGSVTADDITGSDSSLGVAGLQAAQGGAIAVVGGTSTTSGNAGGAITITGGTPGATGVGGAITVAGGAGGSTSGTGGAVVIAGGAGTAGNANGGALTLRGGAKNGSGTDGAIAIGDSNTASVTFGKMPRIPTATVAATGSVQGDAAAVGEGFTLVTAADATKGVILPSAVAGMQVIIKNADAANAILKIYPNTSDAINALSANAALSIAAKTSVLLVAYDATTWYTLPLLAS